MSETRAKSLGAIKLQTAAVLDAIEQRVLELQAIEGGENETGRRKTRREQYTAE